MRPKDATLGTSVEPVVARPGETVTFKVSAKLVPGLHIYKYRKDKGPQAAGPVATTFDFFDTAGLEIEGDWTASKAAVRHKEPAFPDLEFVEYYEDEVTWSITLKVPRGAEPGKKELRCQAGYMVCTAKSCSFPGRWTLPAAVLTVVPGAGNDGAGVPQAKPAAATSARPTPAKKDSSSGRRPKDATLSASVEPAEARPGEAVAFKVTAKLDPGRHIYTYTKDTAAQSAGPVPTTFDFFDTAGLAIEGDWAASKPAVKHNEPGFPNLEFVAYYEDDVTWSITLRVPSGTEPGTKELRCQVGYQICTAKSCSFAGQWTLPAVALAVLGGSAEGRPGVPLATPAAVTSTATTPALPATDALASHLATAAPGSSAAATPATTATTPTAAVEVGSSVPESRSGAAAETAVSALERRLTSTATPRAQSEIARKAQQGWIPFLLASAIGGLFALVMPCVWPMVPITVNFFVKQGQGKAGRGKATGLAIVYCLSIISVFTAVGVLFSFFFSASSLQSLANEPWLNLLVAALFIAFGLNLLGLFELRLPSFLLTASSHGESRGGLIGVVFMALTLTITSFTCTFPVVGGLLVMAAGGSFLYPIVGLATFATVLALPFFLLALSPSLISRLPRSGDWMNAVKVVGGLIEIGAALKFLNTAELAYVTPENAWIDAHVVLTSWIALSAVCGLYLLGLFHTDHDHDAVKVGPGRLIFGAAFLGLAVYMAPALCGRPPQSRVWDRLIVGILPPDSGEFYAGTVAAGGASAPALADVRATSADPAQAEREEKKAHGVLWGMSFDQARELAAAQKKPILIDFTGVNCPNCRLMERSVLPLPEVVSLLKRFVTIQLYTDFVPIDSIGRDEREKRAELNQERQLELTQEATNPFYVVLSADGAVLSTIGGYNEPPAFVNFLTNVLEKLPPQMKVAQAESPRSTEGTGADSGPNGTGN
jgi:thiol:disulfide interchange protein DsbD